MRMLCLLLSFGLIAAAAWAEFIPPGDYSDLGLVVRRANGSYDLFEGSGCLLVLPDSLSPQLKRYLGKFIRLDYTRVEEKEGELFDPVGAPIGKIRKIAVLPDAPLHVTARAPDGPFSLGDAVAIEITVRNRSAQPQQFDFGEVEGNLLRDYRSELLFHPAAGKDRHIHTIAANKSLELTIRSVRMAEPGEYDAVIVLGVISDRPVLSNAVRVSVRKPKDRNEETVALLKWLPRAEPMQRIRIAERLLEHGDRSGIGTVLAMLSGKSANKLYSASPAYAFVWKHAGERGERLLMDLLKRRIRQGGALGIIEEVYRSDRAIALLQIMLADRRETARDFSGWCERPRICDVTASWLCGYTDRTMTFPKAGSTQERDRAVAAVIAQLEKDPTLFEVLTRER